MSESTTASGWGMLERVVRLGAVVVSLVIAWTVLDKRIALVEQRLAGIERSMERVERKLETAP